jgi:hypothetical protein
MQLGEGADEGPSLVIDLKQPLRIRVRQSSPVPLP